MCSSFAKRSHEIGIGRIGICPEFGRYRLKFLRVDSVTVELRGVELLSGKHEVTPQQFVLAPDNSSVLSNHPASVRRAHKEVVRQSPVPIEWSPDRYHERLVASDKLWKCGFK